MANAEKTYLTGKGLQELQAELEILKTVNNASFVIVGRHKLVFRTYLNYENGDPVI